MFKGPQETWVERQAYVAMIISSIFLIVLGVWIANPFTDSFVGKPSYRVMHEVFPESVWGLMFLSAGIAKLISSLRGMYTLARTVALYIFSLWFITAGAIIWSTSSAPIVPISIYLAIQAAHHYIMINHKQNLPYNTQEGII